GRERLGRRAHARLDTLELPPDRARRVRLLGAGGRVLRDVPGAARVAPRSDRSAALGVTLVPVQAETDRARRDLIVEAVVAALDDARLQVDREEPRRQELEADAGHQRAASAEVVLRVVVLRVEV